MENIIEKILCGSRWIIAPVYIGMSIALAALAIKFFQELYYFVPMILIMSEGEMILKILTLIDITLVSSLVIIVMLSGYDNFVSQLKIVDQDVKIEWLGSHDYGALKMKVASSIVAISSIHLLKIFMNIETTSSEKLTWYVVIHLTLVLSTLMMGYINNLSKD